MLIMMNNLLDKINQMAHFFNLSFGKEIQSKVDNKLKK